MLATLGTYRFTPMALNLDQVNFYHTIVKLVSVIVTKPPVSKIMSKQNSAHKRIPGIPGFPVLTFDACKIIILSHLDFPL